MQTTVPIQVTTMDATIPEGFVFKWNGRTVDSGPLRIRLDNHARGEGDNRGELDYEKNVQAAIREIVNAGHADSAHDLSDGGLGVALAECCANGIGAAIELATELRPELALFHEGPSRVLVSSAVPDEVMRVAKLHGVEAVRIGVTMKARLRIKQNSVTLVDLPLNRLREVSESALESHLMPQHV